jgi:hypothetical protein
MKTKKLFNNSSVDVIDFRIEEAEIGDNGDIILTNDVRGYKATGRTLEWTIKAGEKLEFPAYVADYLLKTFGFLEEYKIEKEPEIKNPKSETKSETKFETKSEIEEVNPEEENQGGYKCKFCGKVYDKKRALSMHMGATHADELSSL